MTLCVVKGLYVSFHVLITFLLPVCKLLVLKFNQKKKKNPRVPRLSMKACKLIFYVKECDGKMKRMFMHAPKSLSFVLTHKNNSNIFNSNLRGG